MFAADTLVGALVYLVIFVIIHVLMMAAGNDFAMSHAGIFATALFTGGFAYLSFRQACRDGKIQ